MLILTRLTVLALDLEGGVAGDEAVRVTLHGLQQQHDKGKVNQCKQISGATSQFRLASV